jgi:hypothetical protein
MTASPRRALGILAGVAAINAAVFSPLGDEWFFAIVFFGTLLTGLVVGVRHGDTAAAAAAWFATGIFWLVLDWAINQEDRLFHLVLAFLMAGLVYLGALAGRGLGHRRQPA